MATAKAASASDSGTSLKMTRTFEATPQRVFDAWLDPGQASKWLGPRTMVARCEALALEPRVGGRYRFKMHTHDGGAQTVAGVYREIARPTRLVFTWAFEGKDKPDQTLVTVTFRPVAGGTEMTLLHENFADSTRRDSHNQGWAGSFEQLAKVLRAEER